MNGLKVVFRQKGKDDVIVTFFNGYRPLEGEKITISGVNGVVKSIEWPYFNEIIAVVA